MLQQAYYAVPCAIRSPNVELWELRLAEKATGTDFAFVDESLVVVVSMHIHLRHIRLQ